MCPCVYLNYLKQKWMTVICDPNWKPQSVHLGTHRLQFTSFKFELRFKVGTTEVTNLGPIFDTFLQCKKPLFKYPEENCSIWLLVSLSYLSVRVKMGHSGDQILHLFKATLHLLFLPPFSLTCSFTSDSFICTKYAEIHKDTVFSLSCFHYKMPSVWNLAMTVCAAVIFRVMGTHAHSAFESLLKLKAALDWGRVVLLGL